MRRTRFMSRMFRALSLISLCLKESRWAPDWPRPEAGKP